MKSESIKYNVLPIDWTLRSGALYFTTTTADSSTLSSLGYFKNINSIKSALDTIGLKEANCSIYKPSKDFDSVKVDFNMEEFDLIQWYISRIIYQFFSENKEVKLKTSNSNEVHVWVKGSPVSTIDYTQYDKFSLKICLSKQKDNPEIQICYHGVVLVYNKSVKDIVRIVSSTKFEEVVYSGEIISWHEIDTQITDYSKMFPVLNPALESDFNVIREFSVNEYGLNSTKVELFYEKFLNNTAFRSKMPIKKSGFLSVKTEDIYELNPGQLTFQYGNNETGISPLNDLKKFKPFKSSVHRDIHIFYIYHMDDRDKIKSVDKDLFIGSGSFDGLADYVNVHSYYDQKSNIEYSDNGESLQQIKNAIEVKKWMQDVKYMALLIPHEEEVHNVVELRIQRELEKAGIVSQVLTNVTQKEKKLNFEEELLKLSVSMLTKLGGTPCRFNSDRKNELVIKLETFIDPIENFQGIKSTISSDSDSVAEISEYFSFAELDILKGAVSYAAQLYMRRFKTLDKIIVHISDQVNKKQYELIKQDLEELDLKTPIFFVSTNSSENTGKSIFVKELHTQNDLDGKFISINRYNHLLFARTLPNTNVKNECLMLTLHIKIECKEAGLLFNKKLIRELLFHVYQSRMVESFIKQDFFSPQIHYG